MSVVLPRLVFLAFVGLTGFITYNALYLQEQRNIAVLPSVPKGPPLPDRPFPAAKPIGSAVSPAVTTDLPPLPARGAPEQLVTAIQRELSVRGYGSGPADGKLRDETRKAIAAFEKDHGLPVTGSPSDELLRHILLGVTASPSTGSVGAQSDSGSAKGDSRVKQVQQILADLGYAPGPIDGAMGPATESAVKAFQRDRKITMTGRITSDLLREIKRVTGRDLAGLASRQ